MDRFMNSTLQNKALLALAMLALSTGVFGKVVPVPSSVEPIRIERAQPRNVVFILSGQYVEK